MSVESSKLDRVGKLGALGISVVAGLGLATSAAAGGAPSTFVVGSVVDAIDDNTADGVCHSAANGCTLRAAVMQANQMTSTSTIVVPRGTFELTIQPAGANGADSGDLNLTAGTDVINISGAGAAATIIDAQQIDRVLSVDGSRTANVSGLTLRNGLVTEEDDYGGGVFNMGTLTLSDCTVSGNGVVIGSGGGLGNGSGGTLHVVRSTVTANHADAGGGILNFGTSVDLVQSTVSANVADIGGGIYNSTLLFVTSSTITQNRSAGDAGGIYNFDTAWTYNATIAFNQADSDDNGSGTGAGVFNAGFAEFYPRNSVLAGNYRSEPPVPDDCAGTLGVFGQTWYSTGSGCVFSPQSVSAESSMIGSLAELGPLQFNGGSTRTHALQAGSDIIDSGIACQEAFGPLLVDQRGGTRNIGTSCDPGAFESSALPAGLIFADGFELGNLWAWG